MVFLLVMKIVEKVIYPIITKPVSVAGFHLNDIACQGNHYGIVTSIDPNSYRPITINWDKNERYCSPQQNSFIENGLAGDRFGGNEGGTRQKTPAEKGVY